MNRPRNFIERKVFYELVSELTRVRDDEPYEDLETAYGDMSRLVVAFLEATPPDDIAALYTKLGWKGSANARQMHLAAKLWMDKYRGE